MNGVSTCLESSRNYVQFVRTGHIVVGDNSPERFSCSHPVVIGLNYVVVELDGGSRAVKDKIVPVAL